MRQSIRLGSYAGIPIGVNWSVLVILILFAWELAYSLTPSSLKTPTAADWVAGIVGAVVLLASLLAHEVSHAVVARHNGVKVKSITLFLFGGVAQFESEATTAGADFRIAAVGPGTSLVLAGLFGAAEGVLIAFGIHGLVVSVLAWLWIINVLLAVFNLIPAAPLDGGRVLRAGLWWRWRDRTRAAIAAARAGRVFGIVLIALGVLGVFYEGIIGLWPALIGMFVYAMARAEENYAGMRADLADLPVTEVMTPNPPVVPLRTTVAEMIERHLAWYQGDAVVVTDDAGYLAGAVTSQAVGHVPVDRRATTAVGDIALPLPVLPVARTGELMGPVLERMTAAEGRPVLVLDDDRRLAGIITAGDVQRAALRRAGWHEHHPGWQQPQGTGRS